MSYYIRGFEKQAEENTRDKSKKLLGLGLAGLTGAVLGVKGRQRYLESHLHRFGSKSKHLGKVFGYAKAKPTKSFSSIGVPNSYGTRGYDLIDNKIIRNDEVTKRYVSVAQPDFYRMVAGGAPQIWKKDGKWHSYVQRHYPAPDSHLSEDGRDRFHSVFTTWDNKPSVALVLDNLSKHRQHIREAWKK